MADIAVQILKSLMFQGVREQYSNVYTFNVDMLSGGVETDEVVIDRLVGLERAVHTPVVTFEGARSYSIGGLQATNVMRAVRDNIALPGLAPADEQAMYRECAFRIDFQLPRSLVLRRRRIGRKFLHTGAAPMLGAVGVGTFDVAGEQPLAGAFRDELLARYATPLTTGWPEGWEFGSHGDPFTDPSVFEYLEHRQFHR